MNRKEVVSFHRVSKSFRIYKSEKTLFRLTKSLLNRHEVQKKIFALKDVSFDLRRGDKVAIIGRNGAGKTTLLRIACGIFLPSEGIVTRSAPLTPLFQYGIGLNPYLSVQENIYIVGAFYGICVDEIKRKLEAILSFSELGDFLYVPVKNLSSGQIQRLAFSVFVQVDEPCLAFDESTSLADLQFQKKTQDYFKRLMNPEKTFLMATHDMTAVRQYCQRALWLEKGKIEMAGDAALVVPAYEKFCLQNFS